MAQVFDPIKHEYRDDGRLILSVTQILWMMGFSNPYAVDARAAEKGTFVHDTCHLYNIKDLNMAKLHAVLRGYLDGYIKFLDDTGFRVILSETPLFSRRGYAGKLDIFGEYPNGKKGLGDIKSGQVDQKSTGLQTGGYDGLIREHLNITEPIDRFALQLFPEGKYKIHPFTDPQEPRIFLGLAAAGNYKRNGG